MEITMGLVQTCVGGIGVIVSLFCLIRSLTSAQAENPAEYDTGAVTKAAGAGYNADSDNMETVLETETVLEDTSGQETTLIN